MTSVPIELLLDSRKTKPYSKDQFFMNLRLNGSEVTWICTHQPPSRMFGYSFLAHCAQGLVTAHLRWLPVGRFVRSLTRSSRTFPVCGSTCATKRVDCGRMFTSLVCE